MPCAWQDAHAQHDPSVFIFKNDGSGVPTLAVTIQVAKPPNGSVVTFRGAGDAFAAAATATATVEVNSAAFKTIHQGGVANFKFPGM